MPTTVNNRDAHLDKFISGVLEEGSSEASRFYFDDPTTVGFNLLFDFEGGEESPLFNEGEHGESAIRYLESIDEPERAQALREFKENLRRIVKEYPYFFTSLTGLGNPYAFNPDVAYESDRILTISTMEAIDMRIGKLVENYIFAYFDIFNRRQMIPENLLYFRVKIIISEIRRFRSFVQSVMPSQANQENQGGTGVVPGLVSDLGENVRNSAGSRLQRRVFSTQAENITIKNPNEESPDKFPNNMKSINDNISTYVYDFTHCVFDFGESHNFMETLTNENPEPVSNSFRIRAGRMHTEHNMNLLDLFVEPNVIGRPESTKSTSDSRPSRRKFITDIKDAANKNIGIAEDVFRREADQFLQDNDPRLISSRFVQNKFINAFDNKFKNFLFGNVFLSQLESTFGNAREGIIQRILDADGQLASIGVNVGQLGETFSENLGGKDVGRQQLQDREDLGGKEVTAEGAEDPIDLSVKDIGKQQLQDREDLGGKEVTAEGAEDREDLGGKEVTAEGAEDREDLGGKDVGRQQLQDSQDLGNKEIVVEGAQDSQDLGGKDVGGINDVDPDDLDGKNVTVEGAQDSQDLGGIQTDQSEQQQSTDLGRVQTGERSQEASDLGGKDVGGQQLQDKGDLSSINVGELGRSFVQDLSAVNVEELDEKNIENLSQVQVGNITLEQISSLGVKQVAGMPIEDLQEMGIIKLGDIDMQTMAQLGSLQVGESDTTSLMKQNIDGFEQAPFSSVLQAFIKANLGNVTTGEPTTDGSPKGLGNVFDSERGKENNPQSLGGVNTGEIDDTQLDQKQVVPRDDLLKSKQGRF